MPDKQDLLVTIQNEKTNRTFLGKRRLALLTKLLKTAKRHSVKTAEDLLDEYLQIRIKPFRGIGHSP